MRELRDFLGVVASGGGSLDNCGALFTEPNGAKMNLRHDWTVEEIRRIHNQAFPDLLFQAQGVHRAHFDAKRVQRSTLLSVKTGGCPENCSYCPQSAHYDTGVEKHSVLPRDYVVQKAREAKEEGRRGSAWGRRGGR